MSAPAVAHGPATIDEPMQCELAPGCAFEGAWPDYLEHAPSHALPHPDDRAAWLRARRTFIGASEIGTVCGLSPWDNALSVYAAKVIGAEKLSTPAMSRGNNFEPGILARYAERHAVTIERPPTRRHECLPFLGATPDGITSAGRAVQVKTINARVARAWSDGPPTYVILQVQQELAVWGLDVADLVVLDGTDLLEREYEIRADAGMFGSAATLAECFWRESIRARRVPVDFDGPTSEETLRQLFPSARDADLLPATEEIVRLATEYAEARTVEKAGKERKAEAKARLCALIGDGSGFIDGPMKRPAIKVTWKNNQPSADGDLDRDALIDALISLYAPTARDQWLARYTTHGPIGTRVLRVTGAALKEV